MSVMVGGTGIIGQDMVCGFSNGKYTQFEGTEIVAENCVKARIKDLVVEGKTYQNLFKAELSQGHADSALISKKTTRVNSEGFNLPVKNFTISVPKEFEVLIYPNYVNNASGFSPWKNKIVWSNSSETNNIRIMIRKPDESNITVDEVIGKVILLEGDYTNTDLPTSINGIESVGEKENNILFIKINDNITSLNLPIPLRSLPNGVCDTIEGNKLIQRVGKAMLDGSDDENWVNGYGGGDGKNNRFEVGFNYAMSVTTNRTIYGLSDKFSYFNTVGIPPSGCFRMVLNTANRLFVLFNPSTDLVPLEDLSAWKTWLSENPVTVYYELATPIIHDLEIPSISTVRGTNIITTENNIKPKLSMKVKVKK